MLLMAVRIGEQRKAKYAKVLEHIGGYYKAQEAPFGVIYQWPQSTIGAGLSFWVARTLLPVTWNHPFGRLESSFRRMLLLLAKCDHVLSFVKVQRRR